MAKQTWKLGSANTEGGFLLGVVMRTRVGSLSERLVEATWLGAVVIVPVAFYFYADRSFEVAKVTLFRSMAVVMLVALVIALMERRHDTDRSTEGEQRALRHAWDWASRPLILPTIAVAGVQILSAAFSLLPRLSIVGLYRRMQGTYTTLCYLVLFFALLHLLRRRGQIHRLVSAIVMTSLPVALYAIVQQFGFDPIGWRGPVGFRESSTLGNPIFLGAYLIMVIPLTLRGLICAVRRHTQRSGSSPGAWVGIGLYTVLLTLQVFSVVLTRSRGPFIGLIGGLLFFLLLTAARRGSRGLLALTLITGLLLGGLLVIANVPGPVRNVLGNIHYVGRLTRIVGSNTVRERVLIWQGAADMVLSGGWRALMGYGPETMYFAFQPYILRELVEATGATLAHDRAHNAAWDALVTQGLLGLGVYLCLFGSVFYRGLQSVGCMKGRRDRLWFLILSGLGVCTGAILPTVLSGTWAFLGLGVSAGLLVAQLLYLLRLVFIRETPEARPKGGDLLFIAILSGLIAHFIEIQVGIPVTVTQVYFWAFAAVIGVACYAELGETEALSPSQDTPRVTSKRRAGGEPVSKRSRRARRVRSRTTRNAFTMLLRSPFASYGLILGLLLLALGTSLIFHAFQIDTHLSLVAILVIAWLVGAGLFFLDVLDWSPLSTREVPRWACLVFLFSLSLLPLLLGLPLHTLGFPPREQRAVIVTIDYLLLGATLVALAFTLPPRPDPGQGLASGRKAWLYLVAVVAAVAVNVRTNLNPARANVWFDASLPLVEAQEWNTGIAALRRATSLAPGQPRYSLFLGRAYTKRASEDLERRDRWLEEADEALQRAVALNPLDPELYAHLGQVTYHKAQAIGGERARSEELLRSLGYFEEAVERSPVVQGGLLRVHRQVVHEELARTLAALGDIEEAVAHAEAARELAPESDRTRLNQLLEELRSQ